MSGFLRDFVPGGEKATELVKKLFYKDAYKIDAKVNDQVEKGRSLRLAPRKPNLDKDFQNSVVETTDLEALFPLIGRARFVDLSGQGFGTAEDFSLRHRLIEFLVQVMDFDSIVLEIPREPARLLDQYVNEGEGNPRIAIEMIDDPRWWTSAFLDLIEWARDHVRDSDDDASLRFFGVAREAMPLDQAAHLSLSGLDSASEHAFRYLDERRSSLEANAHWIIQQLPPDTKTILWGNDFGVLRTSELTPGEYKFALAAQPSLSTFFGGILGERPYRIGIAVGRGWMDSINPASSRDPMPVARPPAGSFEWMGAGTGLSYFLLPDLRGDGSLLDRPLLSRAVLANDPNLGFLTVNLAEAFDALIYVDEVHPTPPLSLQDEIEERILDSNCALGACFE